MDSNMQITSGDLFPQWPLCKHLQAWRASYRRKRIDTGATFLAPDNMQNFAVMSRLYFRTSGKRKARVALMWQSHCAICGAAYTFNKYLNATNLIRTCPAHRGNYRARRGAPRALAGPRAPLQDYVLGELDAMALVADSVTIEALLASCVASMARGNGPRDTRRQMVARCISTLSNRGEVQITGNTIFACKVLQVC